MRKWIIALAILVLGSCSIYVSSPHDAYCWDECHKDYGAQLIRAEWLGDDTQLDITRCACHTQGATYYQHYKRLRP